jgi:hypothetical protein
MLYKLKIVVALRERKKKPSCDFPFWQVSVERGLVVVVTTGGRLYVWDLTGGRGPKVLLKNEEICPLNRYRAYPSNFFQNSSGGGGQRD